MVMPDGSSIIPIHFAIMVNGERVACTPGLVNLHSHDSKPAWQRTQDPRIVNCPLCKKTWEWQEAIANAAELPRKVTA